MVLKQVTTLYELSLQVVSDNIFKFVKEHYEPCEFCSVCKMEQCSAIKPVMEMVNLPDDIIQSVYDKVRPELKLLVTIKPEPNVTILYNFDSDINMFYLLLSLLKVEKTSVKIKDFWFKGYDEDIPFILKFGKNINFLQFEEDKKFHDNNKLQIIEDELQDDHERLIFQQCLRRSKSKNSKPFNISASLCSLILKSANNIQILEFSRDVKVIDELLEVIGRECTQLKVLRNICIDAEYTTAQSFVKLLFHSNEAGTHRNKCCCTLQEVNFDCREFNTEHDMKMNEIIGLLLQNVPHLKSFGRYNVNLVYYLETLKDDEIRETALDFINLDWKVTKQTATMLKSFCPTVRKIDVICLESGVVESLSSLKCLEEISVEAEHFVVSEIFTTQWCNLKVLSVSSPLEDFIYLDVDLVAQNLPLLTELSVDISHVGWEGNTYFNSLEKVAFSTLDSNISWFASFASTVKSIYIFCPNFPYVQVMSPDSCKILLTVPFPNLKYLYMNHFPYNFQFYSNVLAELPKLETCEIYYYEETVIEREQHLEQLSQFLKANNLQCKFRWFSFS